MHGYAKNEKGSYKNILKLNTQNYEKNINLFLDKKCSRYIKCQIVHSSSHIIIDFKNYYVYYNNN